MDIARRVDDANLVVGGVSDIDVADGVRPCAARRINLSGCGRAAISGRARGSRAGNQIHQAGGDFDLEHFVEAVVGNIDVARSVAPHATRFADVDQGRRATRDCCGNASSARDSACEVGDDSIGRDAADQLVTNVAEIDIAEWICNNGAHIIRRSEGDCSRLASVSKAVSGTAAGGVCVAHGRTACDGRHGVRQ